MLALSLKVKREQNQLPLVLTTGRSNSINLKRQIVVWIKPCCRSSGSQGRSRDSKFDAEFSYVKDAQKIDRPPRRQQYRPGYVASPPCTLLYVYKTAPKVGDRASQ